MTASSFQILVFIIILVLGSAQKNSGPSFGVIKSWNYTPSLSLMFSKFSPDGKFLAVGVVGLGIHFYNATDNFSSGKLFKGFKTAEGISYASDFTSNGSVFAYA